MLITGANFVSTSAVTVGQYEKLPTTFVSSTQLRATLPDRIAAFGKLDVSVTNPEPGGGASNILTLDIGMEYAGSIGGGVPTVAVSGTLAYIGEGSELTVLDISNPAAPARLGGLTTRERVHDIELAGSRLYLTADHDGLLIVDVADPAHPTLLGSIDTPGNAYDVQVAGDRAYIADGERGMQIVDVGDPAHPAALGIFKVYPAYDLAVVGNIVYIATGTSGTLTLVDVSDPAHPTELTSWYGQYNTLGVQVVGNVAYVTRGNAGLVLLNAVGYQICPLDISDPARPVSKGLCFQRNTSATIYDFEVIGSLIYLAEGTLNDGTLEILDLNAPASQANNWFSERYMADQALGIQIVGQLACIASGEGGIQILRIHQDLFAAAGTIAPSGGSVSNRDGSVSLQFPPNAVTTPITITYAGLVGPTQPLGGAQGAGHSFLLEARDGNGNLVTQFAQPYTLVISYTDEELAARGIDEQDLNLAFWNGSAWVNVLPCAGCGVDTVNNRLTAVLDHFTEFALLSGVPLAGDGKSRVYLAVIRR